MDLSSYRPQLCSTTFVDIWLQGLAIVLPQVQQELLPVRVEFATLALYVGLILGATTWGVMADLIGRKLSFNVNDVLAYPQWSYLSSVISDLSRLPCSWQGCLALWLGDPRTLSPSRLWWRVLVSVLVESALVTSRTT